MSETNGGTTDLEQKQWRLSQETRQHRLERLILELQAEVRRGFRDLAAEMAELKDKGDK